MRLASFTLKDFNSPGFGTDAEKALSLLPGVSDVLIGEVSDICSVVYDEVKVSTLMLRNALQGAGYNCEIQEPMPAKTSCCGGCS
ncbi:hypothetical protein GTP46_08180 [Duganella sp. FT135W]|uniref:Uncharacterized protein n=1 Tax=Duganella flavida TaxID=2692175 RepID=A0A6L8KDW0_9BURK|nr:hypothetical protein [Duganella flavida]MYM22621.1 hypothetical protein [Duganella flavida]